VQLTFNIKFSSKFQGLLAELWNLTVIVPVVKVKASQLVCNATVIIFSKKLETTWS